MPTHSPTLKGYLEDMEPEAIEARYGDRLAPEAREYLARFLALDDELQNLDNLITPPNDINTAFQLTDSATPGLVRRTLRGWPWLTAAATIFVVGICLTVSSLKQPGPPLPEQLRSLADDDPAGKLFVPVWTGNTSTIEAVLKTGVDVNLQDRSSGWSALIVAAVLGRPDKINLLLRHGADTELTNRLGLTALALAAQQDQSESAATLIEAGADIEARERQQRTPLMLAAGAGHESTTRYLLQQGADATARDRRGWTAADWARFSGHNHIAQLIESD